MKLSLILAVCLLMYGCGRSQEVIFEGSSISYKRGDSHYKDDMQKECAELSKELQPYLDKGWKVVSSAPKEKVVARNRGTCVGTEYVLDKPFF